jgi:hypothetical protein
MTSSSLVVVADRGGLKAYKVNETPTRGPSLQLVQAFNITDAHGKLMDKLTDVAGRFPVGDAGSGRHMNAIAERTQLTNEIDRRIYRELAEQIARLVKSDGVEGWSFAAPSEMHGAVVDLLPNEVRDRIVEHVKSDLLRIEPSKLTQHFRSLQPI